MGKKSKKRGDHSRKEGGGASDKSKSDVKSEPQKQNLTPAEVARSIYGEEGDICPICLDKMPVMTWTFGERSRTYCCGTFFCVSCKREKDEREKKRVDEIKSLPVNSKKYNELMVEIHKSQTCPMCREKCHAKALLINANKNLMWAQYYAGQIYQDDYQGAEKNLVEAARWFHKAAEQGHPHAMNDYGVCFELGHGVKPSMAEAIKWYKKSAELGYPEAQCKLGTCYDHGVEVNQNFQEAFRLFVLAAEQGEENAQYNVGLYLIQGKGVDMNEPLGMKHLRMAAAQGNEVAKNTVSEFEERFSSVCFQCKRARPANGKLLRCTQCKVYHYCSRTCQKIHWKHDHKQQCCEQH